MHKVIDSLKYIKLKDVFAPVLLLIALPLAIVYKCYLKIANKPLWLICENGETARDNSYYFYKYLRENHSEINSRYVIGKKSNDFGKINKLGIKPVQPFGLKHYIMYLSAKWNISNHKHGNPNAILFYVLHVSFGMLSNRVFLQHGVVKDYLPFCYFKNTKFRYFVTSSKREFDFVDKEFGYPKGNVVLTGLPRFDTLVDNSKGKNQILIMPTWRNWLGRETNALYNSGDFRDSQYFKNWNNLINSKELIKWLDENNMTAIFYPHQNMQKYIKHFKASCKRIKVVGLDTDIQKVLRDSSLMITDYSSVYMDFAYMHKPVVYFQFDYEEYRKNQYPEGYFSYKKDGFGPIFEKPEDVVKAIDEVTKDSTKYKKRCNDFFPENDFKNCERIYEVLNGR